MTRIAGLSGGLGSGKTTVCRLFSDLGAVVIEADAIFDELRAPGSPLLREVVAEFGEGALDRSGALHLEALGRMVQGDPQAGRRLGALLHEPWVVEMLRRAGSARDAGTALVVLAIPLLFDAWDRRSGAASYFRFDTTICVWAPRDVQIARTLARDGPPREDVERRIARQTPGDEQRRRADHVIDNSGSLEWTREQVHALHPLLLRGAEDAGAVHLP